MKTYGIPNKSLDIQSDRAGELKTKVRIAATAIYPRKGSSSQSSSSVSSDILSNEQISQAFNSKNEIEETKRHFDDFVPGDSNSDTIRKQIEENLRQIDVLKQQAH